MESEEKSEANQQPLVIRGRAVRADEDGLICLNDIWSAAGFKKHRRPFDWMRLYTTQSRIERVLKLITGKSRNYEKADILRAYKTKVGTNGGTWADPRLALDYAEYLNPALAIEVKEVFLRYKAADPTLADEIMERNGAEAPIVQMADVILGAVASRRNNVTYAKPAKPELAAYVQAQACHSDWAKDSPSSARFLTVWNHKSKG